MKLRTFLFGLDLPIQGHYSKGDSLHDGPGLHSPGPFVKAGFHPLSFLNFQYITVLNFIIFYHHGKALWNRRVYDLGLFLRMRNNQELDPC